MLGAYMTWNLNSFSRFEQYSFYKRVLGKRLRNSVPPTILSSGISSSIAGAAHFGVPPLLAHSPFLAALARRPGLPPAWWGVVHGGGSVALRCPCCGRSRGIWGWLWFSCGVVQYGKGLIFVFQEFFASINKIFSIRRGDWALGYHSRS